MNINRIVKRIKRDLGIYTIAFPFDVDTMIRDILIEDTLPVFSLYVPYEDEILIDLSNCEHGPLPDGSGGEDVSLYIIPEHIARNLLYVKRAVYANTLHKSTYPAYFNFEMTTAIGDLLMANVHRNMVDSITKSLTVKYVHPRKLYIYDAVIHSSIRAQCAFQHDTSFASIPETAAETFFELALLDIKKGLYPSLKPYKNMETPNGQITLDIDGWADAEETRRSMLKDWDEVYHLDRADFDYQ